MVYLNHNSGQARFPSPCFYAHFSALRRKKVMEMPAFGKINNLIQKKGFYALLKVGSKMSKCTNWADGNTFAEHVVT